MKELLRELDTGNQALPPGSTITLLNEHAYKELVASCNIIEKLVNVKLRHVQCNPRYQRSLAAAVNIGDFQAAIVLHGE